MKTSFGILIVGSFILCGCGQASEAPVAREDSDSMAESASDNSPVAREDPEVGAILDQIVTIVLTSPALKSEREFYGTVGDTRCALLNDESGGVPWPDWYTPQMDGMTFLRAGQQAEAISPDRRLLGIRLDKLELGTTTEKETDKFLSGPVQITLTNAGGNPDGKIVMGGAFVYFRIEQEAGAPRLIFSGVSDP